MDSCVEKSGSFVLVGSSLLGVIGSLGVAGAVGGGEVVGGAAAGGTVGGGVIGGGAVGGGAIGGTVGGGAVFATIRAHDIAAGLADIGLIGTIGFSFGLGGGCWVDLAWDGGVAWVGVLGAIVLGKGAFAVGMEVLGEGALAVGVFGAGAFAVVITFGEGAEGLISSPALIGESCFSKLVSSSFFLSSTCKSIFSIGSSFSFSSAVFC